MTAPDARAVRISAAAFTVGGAIVLVAGVVSILIGWPTRAHDLAPMSGPGDLLGRVDQIAPLLSSVLAAAFALIVARLAVRKLLDPRAAAVQLLILGVVIDVCVAGAAGRVGHATDGSVLGAAVACLMGGAAVAVGGVMNLFGREGEASE
jgi:hypothetical protein